MRVFLTGGTGLIGSHVAGALLECGHTVRALVREGSDDRYLRGLGAEIRSGDVTHPNSLQDALVGCDAIVHAAALVVSEADAERYRAVNVIGTRNVLETAARQTVSRAVHVSSVAVYGGAGALRDGAIDESAPRDTPLPAGEVYARSKREAEEVVWELERSGRLEVVVVRPDVVYGERDRAVIPRVVRFVRSPLAFTIRSGRRELPVVYAGNVADGIVRALEAPDAAGRAYNLTTDFPITQREFFEGIARELGQTPRFLPIPYSVAYGLAWAAEFVAALRGGPAPALTRRRVAFFRAGNPYVSRRARDELGWQPRVPHVEGIRRAVRWYLAEGSGAG